MATITFEGSHGSLTCCAVSGHVLALPAPDPERYIEVNLYAFVHEGNATRPIEFGERPDGYCVYTLDRTGARDHCPEELYDADFATLEAADRAFGAQLDAFPDACENVYAMPNRGDETTTQALLEMAR